MHPAMYRWVLEHVNDETSFDPDAAARLIGPGSPHWTWIIEGTLASPSLESRRPLVEDAVFCMEHERWHAAVCTLLPVIEGVVSDASGVLEGMRVGRRFEKLLHSEMGDDWGLLEAMGASHALGVLDAELFTRSDFKSVDASETILNRHLILHGRTTGFGSRSNAMPNVDGARRARRTTERGSSTSYRVGAR